jgi:proline iminopeptidase
MQWNIDALGRRSLYRYLIGQHTPEAYHYLAQEGMSAYLQTSRAANLALNTALKSGYNRLAELSQIKCPCLLLAGEQDRHITVASSRETADRIENCQWQCYPNTAHLFPWEIPGQIFTDIDQWLAFNPQTVRSRYI